MTSRLTLLPLCLLISPALAQTPVAAPINLESPSVVSQGRFLGNIQARAFRGDEGITYGGASLRYGLGNGWEASLLGAFAQRTSTSLPGGAEIRHGGSDIELRAKVSLPTRQIGTSLAAYAGVSAPSTPAQDNLHMAAGVTASYDAGNGKRLILNPRAQLIDRNTIVGIGLGASVPLGSSFGLIGDFTPIVAGDNTLDTQSGDPIRRSTYGITLRFSVPSQGLDLDLGFTNALGQTTGFSLTPGLGSSGALYLAVSGRW